MKSTAQLTAATAALGAIATLAFALVPALRFAYQAASLRVALETAAALIALLAAFLVLGRLRRTRRFDHLLLASGLGTISVANFAVALLLAIEPGFRGARLSTLAATAAGFLLVGWSAFAREHRVTRLPRTAALLLVGTLAASVAGGIALVALAPPGGASIGGIAAAHPGMPHVSSHAGVVAAQSASLLFCVAAAIGFTRRSARDRDEFLRWLALAATLAAFARLHYILYAPTSPAHVYTGDVFRLLFYLVLVAGSVREIGTYWRGMASVAVLEERRRIARELHDGVAQELAFIGRRARRLAAHESRDGADQIAAAADRALADSRRAIAALTRPLGEPLADVLAEAVSEVAERHGIDVDLAVEPDVELDEHARDALIRIACEAVSNAARHGHASVVRIDLSNGRGLHFSVADDGTGFDPDRPTPGRFGLVGMRERAESMGAAFSLESGLGQGTRIELHLP